MKGAILFLEEIGEVPYRVSRLLTHLALTGILDGLSALLIGDLGLDPEPFVPMLMERVGGPVVTGLPVGHLLGQWILPTGSRAAIDTAAGSLIFHGRA
jgi:muramoyltetrapeptide carboxypeptidase